MNFSVRNEEINDSEAIAELSGQLGYNSNSELIRNRLSEIIKHNDNCVFDALVNEKIIG